MSNESLTSLVSTKIFSLFRYLTRCILIQFNEPSLEMSLKTYLQPPDLLRVGTSAIGHLISFGQLFLLSGVSKMDEKILTKIQISLKGGNHSLPPNYVLMLWFTLQVLAF